MLDQLTIESFEPLVGSSFWAEFPNGAKVELRLTGAAKVMESEAARLARHPFSLFFVGPKSYQLKQHIYHVTHDQLGAMDVFLVPVGEDAQTYQYEAVFT
ncbi:MAG TPA: hypothetical protein VM733_21400 [Thermoanaerobaculia bacterium]|nr:hypothetical protein [Thermoanaerobaculia bacterium]